LNLSLQYTQGISGNEFQKSVFRTGVAQSEQRSAVIECRFTSIAQWSVPCDYYHRVWGTLRD